MNFSLCLQLLLLENLFLSAATDQHWVASFVSVFCFFFYHPFLFFCEHVDSSLNRIHHLMVKILVTGSFIWVNSSYMCKSRLLIFSANLRMTVSLLDLSYDYTNLVESAGMDVGFWKLFPYVAGNWIFFHLVLRIRSLLNELDKIRRFSWDTLAG